MNPLHVYVVLAWSGLSSGRLNVLFLMADDLRPSLGCYGSEHGEPPFQTPNVDRLASCGALFLTAFAQLALCGPSRTSLLTSRRPDSLQAFDNRHAYWRCPSSPSAPSHGEQLRESVGNFTTLPQFFRERGFETVSLGKIFHPGKLSGHTDDYPYSWSRPAFHASSERFKNAKVCPNVGMGAGRNLICPVNVKDQPEGTLPDLQIADEAIKVLNEFKTKTKPFFLAVGFHKPHIPFKYPEPFNRIYNLSKVTCAPDKTRSPKLPNVAWNPWEDLRIREDIARLNVSFPFGPLPDLVQRAVRRAYWASVAYMDAQVGRVLHALSATGKANSTLIVFTSDHGWSLGEHGEWAKYSNFERATRVPLIISTPEQRAKGIRVSGLVELVGLFPTVVKLVFGERLPRCRRRRGRLCTEGRSFVKLLGGRGKSSSAAFWQFPRPSLLPQRNSDEPNFRDIRFMGYTIRTPKFRYTQWRAFTPRTDRPGEMVSEELYNLQRDPREDNNVAAILTNRYIVGRMRRRLKRRWPML